MLTISNTTLVILVITWLVVGFISLVASWFLDMRGEEYDPYYFKDDGMFLACFLMIMFGYITPIIMLFYYLPKKINFKFSFTKFIYDLANINTKKTNKKLERGVWHGSRDIEN